MARLAIVAGLFFGFLPCTGCAGSVLAGKWRLLKATPNRDAFAIDQVTFEKDGRFRATMTIEGRTAQEQGTYTFNGFKIIFRPVGGGQREYNATLQFNQLRVIDAAKRQVVLKRE